MHILINGSFWHQPTVGSGQYVHGLARWLPQVGPQHRYTLLVPATAMAQAPAPPPGVRLLPLRTPFDGRNDNLAKLWFEQVSVPTAARIIATVGKQTPGAQRRGAEVQRRRDLILRTAYCVLRAETYASFASFADRLPSPVSRLRSPVSGLPSPVLLHIPYFAPPLRCAVPVVTTVGDIIPLLLPEYRGGRHVQAYMALVQRAVRGSAHLLTFSDWSKRDIVQHLGLPPARITATLLAADDRYQAGTQRRTRSSQRFFEEGILEESSASSAHPVVKNLSASSAVNKRYGLESPFIYYVGGLDARKNVATLVRAFGLLRGQGYHHVTLAIAGKALGGDGRLFPDLDGLIAELGLTEAVRRINVPHEDGPLLYQAATIFAFPSRYEGFGLPPLEAMASGTPVVCSSSSSLPEVVGDAALLVEPDDVAGWAVALRRLLDDEQLREELRARGLARAAHFSYRRVAEETLAVYEAIDD